MKKMFIKSLFVGAMLTCGSASMNAQSVLDSVLGSFAGAVTGNSGTSSDDTKSSILSGLSTIFSNSKVATADKIVGTWVYEEPAVVFESSNIMKKAGGKLVASAIEKRVQSTLDKYGIKKGKMTMTFDKKGNFTQTIAKKKVKGTYTIDGKNVELKYNGQVSQLLGTTQLDRNSLLIVMDASRLLKFAGVVGNLSGNTMLKTAGSLLSGMDGMECGVRLVKK